MKTLGQLVLLSGVLLTGPVGVASAQHSHDEMATAMSAEDMKAMNAHMEMTPRRSPTRATGMALAALRVPDNRGAG